MTTPLTAEEIAKIEGRLAKDALVRGALDDRGSLSAQALRLIRQLRGAWTPTLADRECIAELRTEVENQMARIAELERERDELAARVEFLS